MPSMAKNFTTTYKPPLKIIWWFYFALIVLLQVLSIFLLPGGTIVDFAWFVGGSIGLVGLYGYVRQQAFGARPFWVIYFFVAAFGFIYNIIAVFPHDGLRDYAVMGSLLTMLPLLWALFDYAFRSNDLWLSKRKSISGSDV